MTDYAVYRLNTKEKLLFLSLTAGALTGIGYLFYDVLWGALLTLPVCLAISPYLKRLLAERRRKELRDQFRDALYSFSASFATGRYLTEALGEARKYLTGIYGEQAVLVREFGEMYRLITGAGASEVDVWQDLARRTRLEDIADLAAVFRACRDAGGDLVRAVDKASGVLAEKMAVEKEIRTMSAQRRYEGRLIGIMPLVIIVFLRLSAPGYLDVLYRTVAGRLLMSAALLLMILSYVMTERITAIRI